MMCEVCNHEDNRGKMIIICPVCLTNNKLAERKQGALEAYKLVVKEMDWIDGIQVTPEKDKLNRLRIIIESKVKELEEVEQK